MPPGTRALAFVSRWFDPQTVANVFEPLVADWQRHWSDCRPSQRPAAWLGGASALAISAFAAAPRALLAPWPNRTLPRIVLRVTVWTLALAVLLSIPFMPRSAA